MYDVSLEGDASFGRRSLSSGRFRVEEFRLPLVDARLSGPKDVQVARRELGLSAQLRLSLRRRCGPGAGPGHGGVA